MNTNDLVPWTVHEAETLCNIAGFLNVSSEGDAVRCSCPHGLLDKQKHNHKNVDNPAYVITVTYSGWLRGYCFSCMDNDEYDDVEILLQELRHQERMEGTNKLSDSFSKAILFCCEHHIEGFATSSTAAVEVTKKEFQEYPQKLWNIYPSAFQNKAALAYLADRGLSDDTIKALDIRYGFYNYFDQEIPSVLYVGFTYKNALGKLAGIRWRCTLPDSEYTTEAGLKRGYRILKHSPFLNTKVQDNMSFTWYRESELNECEPIVVVEGQFDAAAIIPFYPNVTCLFTKSASESKLSTLDSCHSIIWIGDNDESGVKGRKTAKAHFAAKGVPYLDLYYPDMYKDAGETPMEVLEPLILNAVADVKLQLIAIQQKWE